MRDARRVVRTERGGGLHAPNIRLWSPLPPLSRTLGASHSLSSPAWTRRKQRGNIEPVEMSTKLRESFHNVQRMPLLHVDWDHFPQL